MAGTIQTVVITGVLGNLGTKLFRHLRTQETVTRLIGLDVRAASETPAALVDGVEYIQCNLVDWHDQRWRTALEQADAVVHFAAQNPYLDATWEDAAVSLDMTLYIANAAVEAGLKRVVFAISNHVMGRYKDDPLWGQVGPGELRPDLPPGGGTISYLGGQTMDSTAYATSKLMGERVCKATALRAAGRTTFAQ
jgi:nucleoside-diphosphate-sugar epimerase